MKDKHPQHPIHQWVAESVEPDFSYGFTDRLMKHLVPTPAVEPLGQVMVWMFRRVALACLLLAGLLVAYNSFVQGPLSEDQSALEMAFGVPAVTVDAALSDLYQPLP